MAQTLTSVENIALRLVFRFMGESQFNRSYEDYVRIASELPPLKVLLYEVNRLLAEMLERYGPPYEICRFRAGDKRYCYEGFPTSISRETLRTGLVKSGMREATRRR